MRIIEWLAIHRLVQHSADAFSVLVSQKVFRQCHKRYIKLQEFHKHKSTSIDINQNTFKEALV